jgi:hypothetical protein
MVVVKKRATYNYIYNADRTTVLMDCSGFQKGNGIHLQLYTTIFATNRFYHYLNTPIFGIYCIHPPLV